MRKLRVICSAVMVSLLASSLVVNTVNARVQAAVSVESEDDGVTYYEEEDGVTVADLYKNTVAGDEEILEMAPFVDPNGIATLTTWYDDYYGGFTLNSGNTMVLRSEIIYEKQHIVKVKFKTDKICTLTVGLRTAGTKTVLASKTIPFPKNQSVTTSFTLQPGKMVNAFIINDTDSSINFSGVNVIFVCE
ncbi:MAG: hypothetical protein J1E62_03420 [Lachnospiraceae bacterium]|nr:hypothetical protein [Lachnospiraceae bacterium]